MDAKEMNKITKEAGEIINTQRSEQKKMQKGEPFRSDPGYKPTKQDYVDLLFIYRRAEVK